MSLAKTKILQVLAFTKRGEWTISEPLRCCIEIIMTDKPFILFCMLHKTACELELCHFSFKLHQHIVIQMEQCNGSMAYQVTYGADIVYAHVHKQ